MIIFLLQGHIFHMLINSFLHWGPSHELLCGIKQSYIQIHIHYTFYFFFHSSFIFLIFCVNFSNLSSNSLPEGYICDYVQVYQVIHQIQSHFSFQDDCWWCPLCAAPIWTCCALDMRAGVRGLPSSASQGLPSPLSWVGSLVSRNSCTPLSWFTPSFTPVASLAKLYGRKII